MVAIGVLLIAVMAAFSSQITSLNLMRNSRETNTAMADLQAAMEKILIAVPQSLPEHADYGDGQAIAEYDDLHLSNEQIVVEYPGYVAGDPVPDPLSILLTVTWNDFQGRSRRLQLSSVKAQ